MSGSTRGGRSFVVAPLTAACLLACSGLGPDAVADAQPARNAPSAVVNVYQDADWYRLRPEREQRWTGVLKKREVVASPAGRTALAFELATADAVYPVYAAGMIETLAPIVGRRVEVEGKLVDLASEGFGKELWIAALRILDGGPRP